MSDVLISARGLTKSYPLPRRELFAARRTSDALMSTDLDITRGSSLGIIGESGSGKSTLVRLLLGLGHPSSGTVTFDGRTVDAGARAGEQRWLRRRSGVVFQDPYGSLDPRMSVGRIVAEPLWALRIAGDHRARTQEVLTQVGLPADATSRYPHEFSGGQRQRIALARAIVHGPDVLFGDEPLSALDVSVRARIIDLLRGLRRDTGMTLVMVSHDIGVVQALCEETVVMTQGTIVERGTSAEVLRAPQHPYTRRLLDAVPRLP